MKILIADDHALYRDGLRLNLNNLLPDAKILDAADFSQTLELLKLNQDIDLVLTDLDMPDANWEEQIRKMKNSSAARIGVISASEDAYNMKKALNLMVKCFSML